MAVDLMRVECHACGTSLAIERTEQALILHCPQCGAGIEINQLPTESVNGFCRFCHRTYDDHNWNMQQGSLEHTCQEVKK